MNIYKYIQYDVRNIYVSISKDTDIDISQGDMRIGAPQYASQGLLQQVYAPQYASQDREEQVPNPESREV